MRGLLAVLVLAACTQAPPDAPDEPRTSDLVYRQGTYAVRLLDSPCAYPDFAAVLENEGIPPAGYAVVTSGQRKWAACWVKNMDGDFLLLEPGQQESGTLPKEGFGSVSVWK